MSRASVRRILERVGIRSPRQRRISPHRSRRQRYVQEGMLVQIDGVLIGGWDRNEAS
jgi:hypothetical protein